MLTTRLIPVLLYKNGILVRSRTFSLHQAIGDPITQVQRLTAWKADELIYLEHGAHYAIGALGLLMLAKVVLTPLHIEMPEWLSGLIGILFLVLALADSLRHRRRQASPGG